MYTESGNNRFRKTNTQQLYTPRDHYTPPTNEADCERPLRPTNEADCKRPIKPSTS